MFTLDQINEIHNRLGKSGTLAKFLHTLNEIGVERYDSFIADGHSEYYGKGDVKLTSPPVHEKLLIADICDKKKFLEQLILHEQGKTDYMEMSQGLAQSGIERWAFDTNKMTIAYYSKSGEEMLVESIN